MTVLKTAAPAFLSVPNNHIKRVLIEGKVHSVDGPQCVIAFDQVAGLAMGMDVTLYADVRGKFFQQAAKVVSESAAEGSVLIVFETIGDPVSAEQRGSYRTITVLLDYPVQVDRIAGCTLADVSPEGVGIITPKPLTVGSLVDVNLQVENQTVTERMKVQGLKILPNGKMRFGLFIPSKSSPSRAKLQKIATYFQRVQLRRLSGAA